MKPGDDAKIKDLHIGDCFEDETKRVFRKIAPFTIRDVTFNIVDVYTKDCISVDENYEIVFLKHSPWNEDYDMQEIMHPTFEEAGLERQIEFFDNYLHMMEKFLESHIDSWEKELEQYPKDYKPNPDQIYQIGEMTVKVDPVAEDIREIKDRIRELEEYANLLRKSFFISLYTFLETRLNQECVRRAKYSIDTTIALSDLYGRGIDRAKTYLVKVLGSTFPFGTSQEWEEIKQYAKLRNSIVHNDGKIKKYNLQKYVEKHDELYFDGYPGKWVFLTKGFCRTALSTIESFLSALYRYFKYDEILDYKL
jgi:uncharacterized protein YutE (UPF0331/DUF86 family)